MANRTGITIAAVVIFGAFAVLTTVAAMHGYSPLDAQYEITGANTTDPPADQPKDRVALFLAGEGAKAIYHAMKVSEERADVCEKGLRVKTAGGLVCAKSWDLHYSCSVAIILSSGETRAAGSC